MPTTATWYHANVKSISRGNNKTYVGAVAYITGEKIYDQENKRGCYRGHPGEVLSWGIVAPRGAPEWFSDKAKISKIANAVQASETRSNAQFSNHWDIALWRHATPEQNEALMRRIATRYAERYKVIVPYAVHAPSGEGSEDNQHGHLVPNMRRVSADGIGEKATEITDGKTRRLETEWVRRMIAEEVNDFLRSVNSDERITHQSYKSRGILKEATVHLGNNAWQAEKRGESTKFGEINRGVRERNAAHDTEMAAFDQTIDRLQQQGVKKVEIPEQEQDIRDQRILADLGTMAERRQRVAAWDEWSEEEQKRLARTTTSRDERMETSANRGDIPDANDRWAKAMHDSYNPLARPESNMVVAVGLEAERFRKEQQEYRKNEAEQTDPAKKRLLEFDRQISACDYMQIGAERCAMITGFIVGNRDNAISNRDRENAKDWYEIGAKLRQDRSELREVINKGLHEEIDTFLKDASRGWQPVRSQRENTEEQVKEQFYAVPEPQQGPVFTRDMPAWQTQPSAWRNMEPNEKLEPGQKFQIDEKSGRMQVPEKPPERRATEVNAEKQNSEENNFDQELASKWHQAQANVGRSKGGMSR